MEIGKAFGELTVIASAGHDYGAMWLCRCSCGAELRRRGCELRRMVRAFKNGQRSSPVACPACVLAWAKGRRDMASPGTTHDCNC